jgi:hypothetical protein
METLQIGKTIKKFASTWNELRRQQLLNILNEIYSEAQPDRRLKLLSLLTGFRLPLLAGLPVDILAQLLPLVDFIESEAHVLTEQLLPTLTIPGRHVTEKAATWHGPLGHFQNLLFGEFIFADTFFVLYLLHGKKEYLDKFITVLYRPARRVKAAAGLVEQDASPEDLDWTGDVRLPFNEHQLDIRTPRVFRVAALEKAAVLTWYRGCRSQLALEFPDVFVEADKDSSTSSKQAPDWGRVLRKLSGGAFGAVTQTASQPLRLILAEMQDMATDVQRLKKNTPHA